MTAVARQLQTHTSPTSLHLLRSLDTQVSSALTGPVTDVETRDRIVRESGTLRWIQQLTEKAKRDQEQRQRELQSRWLKAREQLNGLHQAGQPSPAALVDQMDAFQQRIEEAEARHSTKQADFETRNKELTRILHSHFADILRDQAKIRAKFRRFLIVCEELLRQDLSRSKRRALIKEQNKLRGVMSRIKVCHGQYRLSMDASNLTRNKAKAAEASRQTNSYIRELQAKIKTTRQQLADIYGTQTELQSLVEAYRTAKWEALRPCTLLQERQESLRQAAERRERAKRVEHWSFEG